MQLQFLFFACSNVQYSNSTLSLSIYIHVYIYISIQKKSQVAKHQPVQLLFTKIVSRKLDFGFTSWFF